jgi:hypothetical protein
MDLATSAVDLSEFGAAVGRLRGRTELRDLADALDDLVEEKGEPAIAELADLLQHWPGGWLAPNLAPPESPTIDSP